jgi:hypothetical protein
MKIVEVFKVTTTRPLNALNVVGIAELAQFTDFDPTSSVTKAAAAFHTLQYLWSWEYLNHDLEYLDFNGLRMFFKDGSSLTLKV